MNLNNHYDQKKVAVQGFAVDYLEKDVSDSGHVKNLKPLLDSKKGSRTDSISMDKANFEEDKNIKVNKKNSKN